MRPEEIPYGRPLGLPVTAMEAHEALKVLARVAVDDLPLRPQVWGREPEGLRENMGRTSREPGEGQQR